MYILHNGDLYRKCNYKDDELDGENIQYFDISEVSEKSKNIKFKKNRYTYQYRLFISYKWKYFVKLQFFLYQKYYNLDGNEIIKELI